MSNAIQVEHCFLLSPERVQEFTKSWVEVTEKNIKTFIRNVLNNGNLSDIANETWLIVQVVIYLSNFCSSTKQLIDVLQNNKFLEEIRSLDHLSRLQYVIENSFQEEWWFDISKVNLLAEKWEEYKEEKQKEADDKAREEREGMEKLNSDRYTLLCNYFWVKDAQDGRIALSNNGIGRSTLAEEIIQYCTENNITELWWEGGWTFPTWADFLNWYADVNHLPQSYSGDEIAIYTWVDHLRSLYL